MDRAYEANAAGAPPAPPNPPTLGYPSETVPATTPGAWWFHMVTEEIRAAVVAAGIAPDATKVNQLSLAIAAMISSAIQNAAINWNQIQGVPSNTGAVANTLALRDGSAGLTAAGFNVSSDERLKDAIAPITGALDRLQLWAPVTYTRKRNRERYAGFIAQHVAKVRPEGVRKDKDGFLRVDVMAALAEIAAAVRELRDEHRARVAQGAGDR